MTRVRACALPHGALLRRHEAHGYVDCFSADIARDVSHAAFVRAFYTTAVFKAERLVLAALSMPSTDAEAAQIAGGMRDRFAAWTVEARAPDQLLLRAVGAKTRSWLMTAPLGTDATRLYFGSAVAGMRDAATGEVRLPPTYRVLLGCHRLYSRVLLAAARRRLLGSA